MALSAVNGESWIGFMRSTGGARINNQVRCQSKPAGGRGWKSGSLPTGHSLPRRFPRSRDKMLL
eukprot:scaffold67_cov192-Alexandrium_tamarense.AAC.21